MDRFFFFILFFGLGLYYVNDIRNFFLNDIDITLNLISPEEIIWIILTIAFTVAIAGTLPFFYAYKFGYL